MKTLRTRLSSKGLLAATVLLAFASAPACATVIFDTFFPGNVSTFPSLAISRSDADGISQQLGESFTLAATTTITDILTAIQGTGTVTLGIKASEIVGGHDVPSSAFHFSTSLVNPVGNGEASGLNWTLTSGKYWLAGQAATDGTRTFWSTGTSGETAVNVNNSAWFLSPSSGGRAVRINGDLSSVSVPEPGTWMIMAGGLALLSGLRRRKFGN